MSQLTELDRDLIGTCLEAAHRGPFFFDGEFHTIFGLSRDELKAISDSWPDVDERSEQVRLAISNSMNNLIGFPHHQPEELRRYVSGGPRAILEALERWRANAR